MDNNAMALMIVVQVSITLAMAYFFYKVLTAPPKNEPDSFEENDPE